VKQAVRRLRDAFGGLRLEIQDEIAEGDASGGSKATRSSNTGEVAMISKQPQ
jgi:hypothetical protein